MWCIKSVGVTGACPGYGRLRTGNRPKKEIWLSRARAIYDILPSGDLAGSPFRGKRRPDRETGRVRPKPFRRACVCAVVRRRRRRAASSTGRESLTGPSAGDGSSGRAKSEREPTENGTVLDGRRVAGLARGRARSLHDATTAATTTTTRPRRPRQVVDEQRSPGSTSGMQRTDELREGNSGEGTHTHDATTATTMTAIATTATGRRRPAQPGELPGCKERRVEGREGSSEEGRRARAQNASNGALERIAGRELPMSRVVYGHRHIGKPVFP